MKIAIYHSLLCSRGGPEKAVLRYIQNTEHDVTLYTLRYEPFNTFEGFKKQEIRVLGLDYDYGQLALTLKNASANINLSEYDRLLISSTENGDLAALRNNSLKTVNLCHKPPETQKNSIIGKARGYLQAKSWGQFDHTVFTSKETKIQTEETGLLEEETSLIEPGVDTDQSIPGNYDQYFFYPTNFDEDRNIELALDAFEKFQNWNPDTEYRFIVAGALTYQNKDNFDRIRSKMEDITGAEYRTDISEEEYRDLYRNSYAVVHTAEDSYGDLTALEAGSYGKPVMATNSSGAEEYVVNDETGYLVYSEPKYVAEAMDELANNPEEVSEKGKNAISYTHKYSWKKFAEELDEVIANV